MLTLQKVRLLLSFMDFSNNGLYGRLESNGSNISMCFSRSLLDILTEWQDMEMSQDKQRLTRYTFELIGDLLLLQEAE